MIYVLVPLDDDDRLGVLFVIPLGVMWYIHTRRVCTSQTQLLRKNPAELRHPRCKEARCREIAPGRCPVAEKWQVRCWYLIVRHGHKGCRFA